MSTLTSIKDLDKYLIEHLPDRELLLLMQTNKQFLQYGQDAYRKRILNKYPLLAKFKKENETWRRLYLEMIFYIAKLKEVYNIDYVPAPSFNPRFFYLDETFHGVREYYFLDYIAETGDLNLFKKYEKRFQRILNDENWIELTLGAAIQSGNIELVKYIEEKYSRLIPFHMDFAIISKNHKMIEYVSNKLLQKANNPTEIAKIYIFARQGAAELGDMELIKYYDDILIDFSTVISNENIYIPFEEAIRSGKPEILDYFINSFKGTQGELYEFLDDAINIVLLEDKLTPVMAKHIFINYNFMVESMIESAKTYKREDILRYITSL